MKKSLKTALGFALLMPTLLLCSSCSEEYGTKGGTETKTCTVESTGMALKVDKDWFETKDGSLIDSFTVKITTTPYERNHDFNIESMTVRLNLSNIQMLYVDINPDEMGRCSVTVTEEIMPLEHFHVWLGVESIKGTYVRDIPSQEEEGHFIEPDYWVRDKYGYYKVYPKEKTAMFEIDENDVNVLTWLGVSLRPTGTLYVPDYATCKNGSKIKTVLGEDKAYALNEYILGAVDTLILDGTFTLRQVTRFLGRNGGDFPALKTLYIKELIYSEPTSVIERLSTPFKNDVTVYIEYQDQDCSDRFGYAKVVTGNDVNFKITKAMKENKKSLFIFLTPLSLIVDLLILIIALAIIVSIIEGIVLSVKRK